MYLCAAIIYVMFKSYNKEVEAQMLLYYSTLPENSRRQYAAIEAAKLGHGGKGHICKLLGLTYHTLQKGAQELESPEANPAAAKGKQRRSGGGRKKICPQPKPSGAIAGLDRPAQSRQPNISRSVLGTPEAQRDCPLVFRETPSGHQQRDSQKGIAFVGL